MIYVIRIMLSLSHHSRRIPSNLSHLDSLGQQVINILEYKDKDYHQRRTMIAQLSKLHIMGEPIREVEYTAVQHETWRSILSQLPVLHQQTMCSTYLKSFKELDQTLHFSSRIPKINDLSNYLKAKTGFQIKPVAGMIHPREFLNCLAFKVFCCGQFIRHHDSLEFATEPDLVHEFVGHVPMFSSPLIADISQKIGELSLGASDEDIEKLGFAYLCTIELGLCIENGRRKAYGAGIAPCIADLRRIQSGDYAWKPFDPFNDFKAETVDYQKPFQYFYLCDSFEAALQKLAKFGESVIFSSITK